MNRNTPRNKSGKSIPSSREGHVQGYRGQNENVTPRLLQVVHSWKTGVRCAWEQGW